MTYEGQALAQQYKKRKQKAKEDEYKKKKTKNKYRRENRPTLGDLKFKPQVINRPLANEDSSTHVTYHLDYNQSPELNHVVHRHQNTLSITNYIHSFLDSSQHENTEAL